MLHRHMNQHVTELWFVQQADQDAEGLEVMHEDALLLSAAGLTLEDSNHCLKTQHDTFAQMHL